MAKDPKSLLSDLIYMVMVDGKIRSSEVLFIKKLAKQMTIPSDQVSELFKNPQPSKPPYSEVERITHFYRLMLVMQVDHETNNAEIVALKNFGLKMGIRPAVPDLILKKMRCYEDGIVPAQELLKIFKIYYN